MLSSLSDTVQIYEKKKKKGAIKRFINMKRKNLSLLQSDYNWVTNSCIISYILKTHSDSSSLKKKKKDREKKQKTKEKDIMKRKQDGNK